jgi:hypothetical protein
MLIFKGPRFCRYTGQHRLDPIAHISGCNSKILVILTAGKSPHRRRSSRVCTLTTVSVSSQSFIV